MYSKQCMCASYASFYASNSPQLYNLLTQSFETIFNLILATTLHKNLSYLSKRLGHEIDFKKFNEMDRSVPRQVLYFLEAPLIKCKQTENFT
jgi:hypothetical protein